MIYNKKIAVEYRDKYYKEILSKNPNEKSVSDDLFFINQHRQFKARALSNIAQLVRNRYFHANGNVAKGEILGYPAIMRMSKIIITKNVKIIGLGIRFWKNEIYNDILLMNIIQGDNNVWDFSEPLVNDISHTHPKSIINYIIYLSLLTVFGSIGKNPLVTNVSSLDHNIKPFEKVSIYQDDNEKYNFNDIINNELLTNWIIKNNKNEIIGNMKLDKFNQDTNFGYDLLFQHHLKNYISKPKAYN